MKEKILKYWFDAYNRRDFSSVQQIYADDAVIHGTGGPYYGGKAVVSLLKIWLEGIPDAQIIPLFTMKEDNDVVVVHWRAEGTFKGPVRDIPPTGEKVAFHGFTCFRCRDDKIIEHYACIDYHPLQPTVSLSGE
ncbi:MAG: hypothetical protein K940chlam3_01202 [Chlamydiae bacterium]|nr:hypothetical protein [Chlamydiota bacterium]